MLKSPVVVASGTFGYAEEFSDFVRFGKLGAIVTKTITLKPRQGNPPPRTAETYAGMLNSVGLENPGVDCFIKEKLPLAAKTGIPVIVSIASQGPRREFLTLAQILNKCSEVSAVEMNISCPNIENRRKNFRSVPLIAQDKRATYNIVRAVRRVTNKTLIVKLSPNVTDITEIAHSVKKAGADAVSMVNTFYGLAIDVATRKPKLGNVVGGLSGPAIKPMALKMVYEVSKKVSIPIIGMGGIMNGDDALEFLIAGASVVAAGTANFINPRVTMEIFDRIKCYLEKNNINDIKKIIGSLKCRI